MKRGNLMLKEVVKVWVLEKLIPWFMKHVWPEISKAIKIYIIECGAKILKYIMKWLKERYNKWSKNTQAKQDSAKQRYEEASRQATNAKNQEEADKYKAIAEVWREVFEQYRAENEQLKVDLAKANDLFENLHLKMGKDVETYIGNFDVDDVMKAKVDSMPALLLPSGKAEKQG